jgi:hypothetical protein
VTQYGMARAVGWLLIMMLPAPCFAQPGELRPLSEEDHFRHPMHDRFYTEGWNYHLMADTGEVLSLSYLFSNIGVTSGSAGVQFTWAKPGSDPVILKDQRSQSEFVADRKAGAIAIGPHCMVVQGHVTRLLFAAQGVRADLTLRAWMPGFQIGNGTTVINKDKGEFNRMFVEIPRGDFDGTVTLHGETWTVKGAVFMDHTLSNVLATSYSRYWYTLRAFFPDHTAIFVGFRYRPEAGGGRWDLGYVTDRKSILGVSTDCQVEPDGNYLGAKGSAMPTAFAVGLSEGDIQLNGTYQDAELYSTSSVLENLNWLVRKVATTFAGNPMIYRFRSHASLILQKSGETVHLEGPAYQAVVTMKN